MGYSGAVPSHGGAFMNGRIKTINHPMYRIRLHGKRGNKFDSLRKRILWNYIAHILASNYPTSTHIKPSYPEKRVRSHIMN